MNKSIPKSTKAIIIGGGVAVVGGSVVVGTDRCGYFELISVS